jgi:hypothetical protein
LTEIAELVFVGIIASSVATWIVVWIGDLGFEPAIRRGVEYLKEDPQLTAHTAASIFAVSIALTGLSALVVFWRPGAEGGLRPGSTPWYDALTRERRRREVHLDVHMSDGRHVFGKLGSYTVDPESAAPDLVLHPRIWVRSAERAELMHLNADSFLIRGVEIRDVQIRYRDKGRLSLGDRFLSWLCDRVNGAQQRAKATTDGASEQPTANEPAAR